MPGANCAFPGCFISRYTKHKDIGRFKLPLRSGDFYNQWKNEILSVLHKYPEADDNLKKNISSGDIFLLKILSTSQNILDINGVLAEETTIQQFFNLAIMILFICKAQLLFLQEIQEVNTKIKKQPHGMMLTTSFFHKEIVTYWQHIYTLGDMYIIF